MNTQKLPDNKQDFYLKLRAIINDWLNSKAGEESKYSEYLMFAPDIFYLLVKLSLDEEVRPIQKAKLLGTVAYFISPIDLLPEGLIGPAGYFDDLVLAAYTLNDIVNKTNPEIVKKLWPGDEDILIVIKKIIKAADNLLGSGILRKIKRLL